MKLAKTVAPLLALVLVPGLSSCTKDDDDGLTDLGLLETSGDGDGDPTTGDGDGDPTTGDGDGDPATGDGDGDPTTGDGDGDPTTGDGDGDPNLCGADPGWGQVAVGQPVKHVMAYDHLGNETNLCEWGGVPLVIDLSAVWCGPCNMASAYLSTGAGQDPFGGIGPSLRSMIDSGTAVWLTYLVEDANGGPATVAMAANWDGMYHHDNIPVLAELDTQMLPSYLQAGCWPTGWVIGPDLNFFALDDCQTWNHLGNMVSTFGP